MKMIRLTPAERAAITRKWRRANVKAHATARNAKLFTKYALGKAGWKVASLDSRNGFEYRGVVDLVAVKRNNRSPDELTIMLIQVKGGSARITKEELLRLRRAANRLQVTWNVAAKPGKALGLKSPSVKVSVFLDVDRRDTMYRREIMSGAAAWMRGRGSDTKTAAQT